MLAFIDRSRTVLHHLLNDEQSAWIALGLVAAALIYALVLSSAASAGYIP